MKGATVYFILYYYTQTISRVVRTQYTDSVLGYTLRSGDVPEFLYRVRIGVSLRTIPAPRFYEFLVCPCFFDEYFAHSLLRTESSAYAQVHPVEPVPSHCEEHEISQRVRVRVSCRTPSASNNVELVVRSLLLLRRRGPSLLLLRRQVAALLLLRQQGPFFAPCCGDGVLLCCCGDGVLLCCCCGDGVSLCCCCGDGVLLCCCCGDGVRGPVTFSLRWRILRNAAYRSVRLRRKPTWPD